MGRGTSAEPGRTSSLWREGPGVGARSLPRAGDDWTLPCPHSGNRGEEGGRVPVGRSYGKLMLLLRGGKEIAVVWPVNLARFTHLTQTLCTKENQRETAGRVSGGGRTGRTVMLSIWPWKMPRTMRTPRRPRTVVPGWQPARDEPSSPGCRRLCGWRATVPTRVRGHIPEGSPMASPGNWATGRPCRLPTDISTASSHPGAGELSEWDGLRKGRPIPSTPPQAPQSGPSLCFGKKRKWNQVWELNRAFNYQIHRKS